MPRSQLCQPLTVGTTECMSLIRLIRVVAMCGWNVRGFARAFRQATLSPLSHDATLLVSTISASY